jgi:hypothetical protein
MFALKTLTMLGFVGCAFGASCLSNDKSPCIPKSQMGEGLAEYVQGGDPCFLNGDDRVNIYFYFF